MQVETASSQVRAYARSDDGEADRKVEKNQRASPDGGGESPAVSVKESQEPRSEPMFIKSDTAAQTGKNLDISV
jgi:hypothetical protein